MPVAGARKLSPEQEQNICARYAGGERSSTLARVHGISVWTVRETLIRGGTPRIGQGGSWKRNGVPFREDFFAQIDTVEKAYWLGFLHADGCLSKQEQVRLSLGRETDGAHVTCFLRDLGLTRSVNVQPHRNRVFYNGIVGSKRMCADLRAFGVVTGDRRWPRLDATVEGGFCLGLFDGDGSWMLGRRGRITASFLVAPAYAETFALTVERHTGLHATPKAYHPKISFVRYSSQAANQALATWMYSGAETYLPRKRKRVEHWVGAGEHQCPA